MVEQPGVLGSGRRTHQSISAEPALSKTGTVARSLSSPGEKSPKSNWEVSECTSNSKCVFQWSCTFSAIGQVLILPHISAFQSKLINIHEQFWTISFPSHLM